MAKGLIDPTTGESVTFGKRYIDDEVDEKPRGALVAKAGLGATVVRGAKATGRFVRSIEPPSHRKQGVMFGGATMYGYDRVSGGHSRRKAFREVDSKHRGDFERLDDAGKPEKALRQFHGRMARQMAVNERSRGEREVKRQVGKRHDESTLEHTGSRRVGGRLPVSSVRTAGLPVQSATFSRGNAEARSGTRSHANKLTHVHTKVKASRTGKLYQLHHRSRSVSGSTLGKSAGFAQSAGNGRRLVNV